jgi:hypothetical protein
MDRDDLRMNRRTALKGAGLAAAAGLGGLVMTGSGAAATLAFTVNDPPARDFNDGQVSAVTVEVEGASLNWAGLDHDATVADVALEAARDGEWHEAAAAEVDLNERKDGAATFDIGPVDLTEATPYTDGDFSADAEGADQATSVPLRLTVTVNTEDGEYTVSAQAEDTLDVTAHNVAKTTGGDALSNTPVTYAGDVLDKNGEDTGEDDHLRIYYGDDEVVFEMDVSSFAGRVSEGAPLNGAIGLDVDEDNVGDHQLGWTPHNGSPVFVVKDGDASGWTSWQDAAGHALVNDAYESGGVVTFHVDRAELGVAAGDTYRTGLFASAGGEEGTVAVSTEQGQFWSTANNWTASTYWIQTTAE